MEIPSLLIEIGSVTHHPYQANVNHRKLNDFCIHFEHGDGNQPLIKSFGSRRGEDSFSAYPMSLLLYGVEEEECDGPFNESDRLQAFGTSEFTIGEKEFCGRGFISNLKVTHVDGRKFKRLLLFFGVTWVDENDEVVDDDVSPSCGDIAAFFQLFQGYSLQTKKEFARFLKDFDMHGIYTCDHDKSENMNRCNFGRLTRSVTNVRQGVPDGQHRMWLFSSLLQGYPSLDKGICDYSELGGFPESVSDPTKWQVWNTMNVLVVQHTLGRRSEHWLKDMQTYSETTTVSMGVKVNITAFQFLCQFCAETVFQHFSEKDCAEVRFDNFWSNYKFKGTTALNENAKRLTEAFFDSMEAKGALIKKEFYSTETQKANLEPGDNGAGVYFSEKMSKMWPTTNSATVSVSS